MNSNFQILYFMMLILLSAKGIFATITDSNNTTNFYKRCNDGEYILSEYFCDGKRDCSDGSDETSQSCIHVKCPKFAFQCAYGGCINKEYICDKVRNCADNSDENLYLCGNENSYLYHGNCLKNQFQCKSEKCILTEDICDGKIDCPDGSDETVDLCAGRFCQVFAFRCGYGACINGKSRCNGIKDCLDGSDEAAVLCEGEDSQNEIFTTTNMQGAGDQNYNQDGSNNAGQQGVNNISDTIPIVFPASSETGCLVNYVPNLIVQLEKTNKTVEAGTYVENYQSVSYKCEPKHILQGAVRSYCIGPKFIPDQPTCTKYCSRAAIIGTSFRTTCEYYGISVSCFDNILPGTVAHITCATGYKKPNHAVQEYIRCNENGEWDYAPFNCEQECGTIPDELQRLNRNSSPIVPWHVPIYSSISGKQERICGGTIINAKIVLSAAHCFWNVKEGNSYNHSYFSIVTGKHYRDFAAIEQFPVQYFNLSEIHIPAGYQDPVLSYEYDIALLVLDKFIEFQAHVKPVCIEWLKCNENLLMSGRIGQIAGWGNMETNKPLDLIELETISNADCMKRNQSRFGSLVTADKFCVSGTIKKILCARDSGGGFVIPKTFNGTTTHFLWGILSYGLNNRRECEDQNSITFTSIQYHSNIIQNYENKFRPK